jgi:hypothetical protein
MFLREQQSSSSPLLFMQSVKGEKVFGYLCRKSEDKLRLGIKNEHVHFLCSRFALSLQKNTK